MKWKFTLTTAFNRIGSETNNNEGKAILHKTVCAERIDRVNKRKCFRLNNFSNETTIDYVNNWFSISFRSLLRTCRHDVIPFS